MGISGMNYFKYRRQMSQLAGYRAFDRKELEREAEARAINEREYPPVPHVIVTVPEPRSIVAERSGDPMPGRSALDQKRNAGELR